MRTSPHLRPRVCLAAMVGTLLAFVWGDVIADELEDKTRAQTLFLEGRKAIDQNSWDVGCPKVRESLALFAVANSHFTVAQCDERDGHVAAALEHWERGLGLVDATDKRAKVAKERITDLEARVPRIQVVIPPASTGASVWLDDVKLAPAVLANPLRVEPGRHVLVVRRKDRQDNRWEIDIAEKERTEFVANVGPAGTPGPVPTSSASAVPAGSSSASLPPSTPSSAPMHPRKTAGFVVGGIGAATLLVSVGTGIGTSSVHGSLQEKCGDSGSCPADEVSQYKNLFMANAVTLGIGLAGIGAGLALILSAPKNTKETTSNTAIVPLAVPGGAGIGLSGRF